MKKKKDKQTAISLFDIFKGLILEKSSQDNGYSKILDILNHAIERVTKGSPIPQLEARAVFRNISTICFVDKIKLNEKEADILQKIDHFSHSKKDEQTAISLFDIFKGLILENSSQDNRYYKILDFLNCAIERVANGSQTPQLEARSVFHNISTICFVDKIKLNVEEAAVLQKIDHFSHSKGIWGEMNTLNISNMCISK